MPSNKFYDSFTTHTANFIYCYNLCKPEIKLISTNTYRRRRLLFNCNYIIPFPLPKINNFPKIFDAKIFTVEEKRGKNVHFVTFFLPRCNKNFLRFLSCFYKIRKKPTKVGTTVFCTFLLSARKFPANHAVSRQNPFRTPPQICREFQTRRT